MYGATTKLYQKHFYFCFNFQVMFEIAQSQTKICSRNGHLATKDICWTRDCICSCSGNCKDRHLRDACSSKKLDMTHSLTNGITHIQGNVVVENEGVPY